MSSRSFTFRLERVRALRERTEDQRKEELAASLTNLLRGESLLEAAIRRREDADRAQRSLISDSALAGPDLIALKGYRERTERLQQAAAEDRDRREAEVTRRRGALRAAAVDRQALERLKERRRDEHRRETDRREAATLDEIAIVRHRRRKGSG